MSGYFYDDSPILRHGKFAQYIAKEYAECTICGCCYRLNRVSYTVQHFPGEFTRFVTECPECHYTNANVIFEDTQKKEHNDYENKF